jgi:drug/metabolite transporter (DMT)-like permease
MLFSRSYMVCDRELKHQWDGQLAAILLVSSIIGTFIGYTSWTCRKLISATSFTVVGVVNKFLTILLNVLVWDKHASLFGIGSLVVALLGGCVYKQAPLRCARSHGGIDNPAKTDCSTEAALFLDKERAIYA